MTLTACEICIGDIRELLANNGYEILTTDDNALRIRDLDSLITLTCVLERDVLYNTIVLDTVENAKLTPDVLHRMLDAENGISTSAFQLYHTSTDKTAIALNNHCKLQEMGTDDHDDILSALNFLIMDTLAAENLLKDLKD